MSDIMINCIHTPCLQLSSRYPNGIFVEGADEPAAAPAAADDDDFFSSWDKPSKPAASKPTPTTPAPPPTIGSRPTPPPSAPRTVTSASLRSNGSASSASTPTSSTARTTTKGSARLGAVSTSSGSSARPAKLGAKKAVATINFEQAEAKARAEEEHAKELELKAQREAEEEQARRAAVAAASPQTSTSTTAAATSSKTASNPSSTKAAGGQDVERLGIGFKRLGFGATAAPASAPAARRATAAEDSPTTAREKFGSQKAISSDMYFERGSYDPASVSEAKTKLAQFQGATSISSSQYFGREEGEDEEGDAGNGSFTGNESLSALESATRDAVTRVFAREDVQNAAESIRAGALKVCILLVSIVRSCR